MKVDVLVAEIGSTTTIVNAFDLDPPRFLGQGQSATTVSCGDVRIGLKNAVSNLEKMLALSFASQTGRADIGNVRPLARSRSPASQVSARRVEWSEMLAASSAAGGLKMCVHGLVHDMTVRSAKEAALGAGAVLKLATAGKLLRTDIAKVAELCPNIILIAGGLDYGERETALFNFEKLARTCPDVPFIYAGNIQNHDEIRLIAEETGVKLYIAENVYPNVDILNVEPTRRIIQDVFEEHITGAPGMSEIRDMVTGKIMPTPGAVMAAARLLYEEIGDLAVFDVGGATTDLHSVTNGHPENTILAISPEPFAKRTVEGDLGVYINIPHIVEKIGHDELKREFPSLPELLATVKPIPGTDEEKRFASRLTQAAVSIALERHAGRLIDSYGPGGKKTVAQGKDLTAVKYVIGTGGALTGLSSGKGILESVLEHTQSPRLGPRKSANVLLDKRYIMASAGVLSAKYRGEASEILKNSILEG